MRTRQTESRTRRSAISRWAAALVALLVIWAVASPSTPRSAPDPAAGVVHFMGSEQPNFDSGARLPRPALRRFVASHLTRMLVYPPSFDPQTSWYRGGWVYQDAYAIYPGSDVARAHPRWILRDRAGRRLYIPWGCSGGSCPQFAGNVANGAFRRHIISSARALLRGGRYSGVYMDDVNLMESVSDGHGNAVVPVDPASGRALGPAAWRSAMASFMTEIRAALPGVEIVHNAVWYAGADAHARQQISAADYINLERGANDAGLTGGSGRFAFTSLLAFIDLVHAIGRHVVLEGNAPAPADMAYNLATYFLVSDGRDLVGSPNQDRGGWWPGFNVVLGQARGPRRAWKGLLRRDFSAGVVLVDPPGGPDLTIVASAPMRSLISAGVRRVALHAGSAVILRGSAQVTAAGSSG